MGAKRPRRNGLATALAALAAICLLVALTAGYARLALFDSDRFADRATAALDDDAVRDEIATRVTDDLVLAAEGDLTAVRPLVEGAVEGLVSADFFTDLLGAGVRDLHRTFFERDRDSVTLTLVDVGMVLRGALQALEPKVAKSIPGGVDIEIAPIEPPPWVAKVARVGHDLTWFAIVLVVGALLALAAALFLAADRRRTLLAFGVAVVLAGVIGAVVLGVARSVVLAQIADTGTRDAAEGVWDAFLGDLGDALYLLAACGAVVAAAASSLLRPVSAGMPLARVWALMRAPERDWVRAVRALALLVVGILVIADRDTFLDLIALVAGLAIAYAGVAELMRMTIAPTDAGERESQAGRGRRALAATGIASALIIAAGAAFVSFGGTSEEAEAVGTSGCNGSGSLCDRPLDEVAIAATHNSMSAVTYKDWLFAQQDAGIADQLRDGVRGLLIDAHYGQPTESGRIKTDLSDVGVGERDSYAETLGPDALDAALRIRDRVVSSPATGPRQVYLCHRFCELGAISIDSALRDVRDFLAANPKEVVVIVIEDYVDPAAIADAVERSGLIDYAYSGPLEPLPTLGQMIDSGGRALVLAENDSGDGEYDWYHPAYEALVQETPYSFNRPEKLTGEKNLKASCEPNRGPESAPLLLLNHWVDTSPAPLPSNAKKVNAPAALMRRVSECEELREMNANLLAVDFYRQGDVFGVADELNEAR